MDEPVGIGPTDKWDGYYWRDRSGNVLTICTGGEGSEIICGAPVISGRYCGSFGRREQCPTHGVIGYPKKGQR